MGCFKRIYNSKYFYGLNQYIKALEIKENVEREEIGEYQDGNCVSGAVSPLPGNSSNDGNGD